MDYSIYHMIAGVSSLIYIAVAGYVLYYVLRYGYVDKTVKYIIFSMTTLSLVLLASSFYFISQI